MSKNLILSAANRERVKELLEQYTQTKAALDRISKGRARTSDLITISITSERNSHEFIDAPLCHGAARSALAIQMSVLSKELLKLNIRVK